MALALWKIHPSKQAKGRCRHYKAYKAVSGNYDRPIEVLERSSNPASLGIPKKGRHGGSLGTHITKSVVLVYRIDYPAHRIDLAWMGDHKEVYWHDG